MKIALLSCTDNLNIGNEFINQGVEYLITRIFPDSTPTKFESLETVCFNRKSFIKPLEKELNSENHLQT